MPKKAKIKYRSLRTNLVHLPLSLYASLTQQQTRPQTILLHLEPLAPSSSRATAAYIGWSGLASASSLAGGVGGEETVEVDPEVAMSLGWNDGMLVEIGIINNPTKARSVNVTPVSEDDWEILEQHASFLEENLLMQMRSATKGQTYDVWVHRTKIRIRVDETDPRTSEKSAVLLHAGTEIYVAPRLRKALPDAASTSEQPVSGPSSRKGKGKEKSAKLRLVPGRIAAQWRSPPHDVGVELGELENVVFCSPDTLRRTKRRLAAVSDGLVYATLMQPGSEATKAENGSEEDKEAPSLDGWLVAWDEMPDGCGALAGPSRDGWTEWCTVRVTQTPPPKGRLKGVKAKDSGGLRFESAPNPPVLSVLQDPVEAGTQYLRRMRWTVNRPLLITGGKGSGKTTVARAIAGALEADTEYPCEPIYEDVGRIDSEGRLKETKTRVEGWLDDARRRRPAVLILDGLDHLLGPEHELTPSSHPTILAEHFCRLFTADRLNGVLVIATAVSTSALHPLLNMKHLFGETVKIPPLTKEWRRDTLQHIVVQSRPPPPTSSQHRVNGNHHAAVEDSPELDYVTLASTTEGYSVSDLTDLVSAATQQSIIRSAKDSSPNAGLQMEDFVLAQAAFTPVSLRGVTLQKSSVAWSDIGGLNEPRRILRETLEWPTKYAQIFASCPLRLRSGLLLYGYPGCGKTLLASAVAKECGLNFISVKGPEILNKYIGASEKSVRDLFERASAAKPCILFFDEFDSIAPKRGHDSTGVTDRVVNQMLTEMDGAQGLDGVYVLAATSRPDLIDSALLRPGRLDKSILCDMPDQDERLDILRAISTKLHLGPDVDLTEIASQTKGFSGADLQALVYNAHLDVVHASITDHGKKTKLPNGNGLSQTQQDKPKYRQIAPVQREQLSTADQTAMDARVATIVGSDAKRKSASRNVSQMTPTTPTIEHRQLVHSLANTRPSVAAADFLRLKRIYSAFSSDREGNMPNGEASRATGTRTSLM